jgi:predicted acylesterase/phospholipase RssA
MVETQLLRSGRTLLIDEAFVTNAFGGSLPDSGSALDASLTHWLNELETENTFLVLVADSGSSAPWVERSQRQADVVLIVADASGQPHELTKTPQGAQLVLLHPPGTAAPAGTAAWLERTGAQTWHHVRAGDAFGVPRLARRLTGHAVGLVFSGGGARGYAHIGLLRAIHELGIEIDMVAGTSMGALIGAALAFKSDWTEVERAAVMFGDKKRLLDNTLPLVALTTSKGVTTTFTTFFADARIEDLWTPFVCVSANLFEAVPVEHTTGLIWEAVRASTAIPGVFTPLVHHGDLLVDGAVMNAFPVDLMREMVENGVVIASSTMAKSPSREPYDFGPSVSGWRALAQYLKPRRRRTRYPSMIKTLMEATSVGSKHQSLTARTLADIVVEMPVQGFGKLEFHRHEELIELGYRYALEVLQAWVGGAGDTGRDAMPRPPAS